MDKKTLILTKEEAIAQHRKMWEWIANMVRKTKSFHLITHYKRTYLETYYPGYDILCNCFLCEYDKQVRGQGESKCKNCPVVWGSKDERCGDRLYNLASCAMTKKEQIKYSKEIAQVLEKEDV